MKIIKYGILSLLVASYSYGIETSYKHNQVANSPISSNLNIDIDLEVETTSIDDILEYSHLQLLVERPLQYMTLGAGTRVVSEESDTESDTTYQPMIEGRYTFDLFNFDIKNRFRYIYNNDEDKHVIRYRVGVPFNLGMGFKLTPSAEAFVDEELNYKRTRYKSDIARAFDRWTAKVGYEYNDNQSANDTQTITTELEYSF